MFKILHVIFFSVLSVCAANAECIQFSGKYDCDQNWRMKIYSSVANDIYTYRFGYVGIWDFVADGRDHAMKWPAGSTYSASCGLNDLDLHQVWLAPDTSVECKDTTQKIVFATHLAAVNKTNDVVDNFSYTREETHYCANGDVVHLPAFTVNCRSAH
jgi:hypothetical protein